MKLKSLFLALLVMLSGVVMAQVESGKVYRIVSSKYKTVITASPITNQLSCVTKGTETDYQQMWEFTLDANSGKYYIQNVFSRLYLQNESAVNVQFKTGSSKVLFAVRENATNAGNYNIDASNRAGGWGLHCDAGSKVVPWSDGPDQDGISGTEWVFEEVANITDIQKGEAYAAYVEYNNVIQNKATIIEKVNGLFADKAGTMLKSEYQSMSDSELLAAMEGVPADLQQAVLKVKNQSWTTETRANLSEKNFRIYDYKPYSDTDKWKDILYHRPFNRINNPTGICSESDKGFIYVFVNEIPEGTEVYLAEMSGTAYFGTETKLGEGLNIVPSVNKDGVLYIRYICDTHTGFDLETRTGLKKLSDYPTLKVHIEGGYVNGFWSKERGHNNDDWIYMRDNMFRNSGSIQAVGDHSQLCFRTYEFLRECPDNIVGVMNLWDFWNERQRFYMALDKYYDWFNNKQLAMSDDNGFMDAGNYRTHYNNNTLNTIVNYDLLIRDAGSSWGPNHEIGHTNQYAFEIVGTSEVSNNALSNFAIFDQGTHTSRGQSMVNQILDYEAEIPYVARGEGIYGTKLFSMTRMYFQLFLYFHAAEKKTDFYPLLFEELRRDKLVGWQTSSDRNLTENKYGYIVGSMDAKNDQLKFVEKCCSIAQMDLTEFFEAWGFFIPMKNIFVGDYGHHHVYLTQGAIDSCKARIKEANYPRKGGHLMFLEDRIYKSPKKKSPFSDGNGYRANYADWEGERIGEVGDFGQWMDYVDETVLAQGYYYAISDGVITIVEDTGAKGALGFKLYDADTDKLITYSNTRSIKIPKAHAGKNYKVVAAQANGEDYIVPHASQGPESMQLQALEKSLATARLYTLRKAVNPIIGYFYPDSVAYLTGLYNDAKTAYDNRDASVRSYAEWSVLLDNECKRLISTDGARLMFEEGIEANIFSVKSNKKLTNSYAGVTTSSHSKDNDAEARWSIEYAGEPGVYYIKCADGNYVKDFEYDSNIYAEVTGTSNAAKVNINYTEDGKIFFTRVGGDDVVCIAESGTQIAVNDYWANVVKGMVSSDEGALWTAWVNTDNSAAHYKQELEKAVEEARFIIAEVLNIENLNTMNIFNNTIVVNDRNLETYIVDLYNHYLTVISDIENAANHKSYLNTFRSLFNKIEGTYTVTAPLATSGDEIVWYRLVEDVDGSYLSVYSGTNANHKDRLAYTDVYGLDDNALWAFAPTGRQNEFKVYNCALNGYVANKEGKNANYLFVVNDDIKPLTVIYDADRKAVLLSDGEKYMRKASSYINLGAFSSALYWKLELVSIEKDEELADIITEIESVLEEGNSNEECYDLHGRRVENPGKGIYIQNGKKVYFK